MKRTLAILLVCVPGLVLAGIERWVSPEGNDAGPGTRSSPWRTLAKAGSVGPGTTVFLLSGVWRERLVPRVSGTEASPIVFAAAPGATPVIDGSSIRLGQGMTGLVHLESLGWVSVRGLTVLHAGPGETAAGIYAGHSEHVAILGCRTSGTASSGIGVWFSRSVLVMDNDVADACHDGSQECISVAGCSGFEIAYNTVHDCTGGTRGGEGIDAKHGSFGLIHHNVVHHIRRLGIYVDAWDVVMHHIEVRDNLVHDTKSNGYALAAEDNGSLEDVTFHDNVAVRNAHAGLTLADWGEQTPHHGLKRIAVEHNTFVGNGTSGWGGGIRLDNAEAEGIVVRENLCADNRGGQILLDKKPKSYSIDHNFVTGRGKDEHEIFGDHPVRGVPVYTISADGVVTVAPDSPGAGFGAGVSSSGGRSSTRR